MRNPRLKRHRGACCLSTVFATRPPGEATHGQNKKTRARGSSTNKLTVFDQRGIHLVVDLPHHLRRLLVALAVNVPQHQDRSSAGELLGEEPPEAAPGAGDHAHLSRDALLLGPHHPLGPGCDEGPEHLEDDHEELREDVDHLGPEWFHLRREEGRSRGDGARSRRQNLGQAPWQRSRTCKSGYEQARYSGQRNFNECRAAGVELRPKCESVALRCGPVASAAAATVWRSELRAATTDSASHFLCRSSTHVIPTRLALRYLCSPPINTGPNRTLTLAPVRMKLWLCNTLEGDIIRKLPPFPLPSSLPSFMPLQFQFSFFFHYFILLLLLLFQTKTLQEHIHYKYITKSVYSLNVS